MPTTARVTMKKLDFLVIGAQKAGTTSLHEYLRTHPELYLPPGKEYSFFDHEHDAYLKHDPQRARQLGRWGAFLADVFEHAPTDRRWGKVSPGYMAGAPLSASAEAAARITQPERVVPGRINERLPGVRLIAILRDPVARARSAHGMASMRGRESRTFDDAIADSLAPAALEQARRLPLESTSYVVLGEYGRVLEPYFRLFGDQLLVIFTDQLEHDRRKTVRTMFEHLGVDPNHVPPNLGHRYLAGASSRHLPWLDPMKLRRAASASPTFRRIWNRMKPGQRRAAIRGFRRGRYWLTLRNRRSGLRTGETMGPETRAALEKHYAPDGKRLEDLLGRRLPWNREPG